MLNREHAGREGLSEVEARLLVLRGHLASVELLTSNTGGQEWRSRLSLSHSDSWEDNSKLGPWCQQEGRVRSLGTGYQVHRPQNTAPTIQGLQEQRLWELSLHAITLGSEQSRLPRIPAPMSPAKWTLWQLGKRGKGGLCRQEGKLTGWARGPWESLVLLLFVF